MQIKKIILENNPIFGDKVEFDFTKEDGSVYNNILLIGENGSGKSSLLDIIFNFSNWEPQDVELLWKIEFEIRLSKSEKNITAGEICTFEGNDFLDLKFTIDWSKEYRDQMKIICQGKEIRRKDEIKEILRSIYSTAEIAFNSDTPRSVTRSTLDQVIKISVKSSPNMADKIVQLLVDIRQQDNEDEASYRDKNGKPIEENNRQLRTKRFKNAFSKIFDILKYLWVDKDLKPIFKKWWEEFDITKLSSGEKQIVFRWWFLLKDQGSLLWAPVLIDEPEISLHPSRQLKILDYYRTIFTDPNTNVQTSQMFFTTHSPYVLKSYKKDDYKIFIFKRDPETQKVVIMPDTDLDDNPTWWEINRYAYDLPTIEFHDELYWYLHENYIDWGSDDKDKNNRSKISSFDVYLFWKIKENKMKYNRLQTDWTTLSDDVTIQTYIRNVVHHPENTHNKLYSMYELKKSIEAMIQLKK